jgi:hypothetical protein
MATCGESAADPARDAGGGPGPAGLVGQPPGRSFVHPVAGDIGCPEEIHLVHRWDSLGIGMIRSPVSVGWFWFSGQIQFDA